MLIVDEMSPSIGHTSQHISEHGYRFNVWHKVQLLSAISITQSAVKFNSKIYNT